MTAAERDAAILATVFERLQESFEVDEAEVDITVRDGEVALTGTVATMGQRAAMLAVVKAIPGVSAVTARLQVMRSIESAEPDRFVP